MGFGSLVCFLGFKKDCESQKMLERMKVVMENAGIDD